MTPTGRRHLSKVHRRERHTFPAEPAGRGRPKREVQSFATTPAILSSLTWV
jgi:hypothetical protein